MWRLASPVPLLVAAAASSQPACLALLAAGLAPRTYAGAVGAALGGGWAVTADVAVALNSFGEGLRVLPQRLRLRCRLLICCTRTAPPDRLHVLANTTQSGSAAGLLAAGLAVVADLLVGLLSGWHHDRTTALAAFSLVVLFPLCCRRV